MAVGIATPLPIDRSGARGMESAPVPPPVVFEHVGKSFPAASGSVDALSDVSLSIGAGEVFGIIGRSGAGKSTLIRTINRLERVSSGRVLVGGTDVASLDDDALVALRRRTGMAVLEGGRLVETGPVWRIFGAPSHPATVALLQPLVHALPAELSARIKADPPSGPHETVLLLRYAGAAAADPSLADLTDALGPGLRLLHGGVDRIQDRAQGRLIVSIEVPARELASRLARARILTDNVEVLGHVPIAA